MNTDFRLSVGIFEHPKVQKLGRRLGDSGILSYIRLLRFVAQNRPDGSLRGMDTEDIALAGGYNGDSDFAAVLLDLRLIDDVDGEYGVHDWAEHNPFAAGAGDRSDQATYAAILRHHGQEVEQHDYEPPRLLPGRVPHYRRRLLHLGNAVVPQVAYPFLQAIADLERARV